MEGSTNERTNERTNIRTDERKDENYIPLGINAGGIKMLRCPYVGVSLAYHYREGVTGTCIITVMNVTLYEIMELTKGLFYDYYHMKMASGEPLSLRCLHPRYILGYGTNV